MKLCVVSFKPCWRDESGRWRSDGGFPLQISALASLFDETTLLTVVVPERDGGIPLSEGIQVVGVPAPMGDDFRRKLSVAWLLPRYIAAFARHFRQADVVHTPLPGDLPLVGLVLAMVMRKKVVARYGGSWVPTARTTFFNRVTRGLLRAGASGPRVMLATGEAPVGGDGRVRFVFSTALSGEELRHIDARTERGLSDPPRLVYVGRLSPEKGVPVLLQALAAVVVASGHRAPRLSLVGDGPQRRELERLAASLGCRPFVTFVGQKTRAELSAELSRADVCVQPSLTEGFSKAWLDAMAHGLPIVSSDVGAARSVVGAPGERGWLVPPGDADALAAVIRQVLAGGADWPALRERCRAYVEGRTLEAWAAAIGDICARQWGLRLAGGRLVA
jgi:glycosyltransferase involved in cell wall biosynthesis